MHQGAPWNLGLDELTAICSHFQMRFLEIIPYDMGMYVSYHMPQSGFAFGRRRPPRITCHRRLGKLNLGATSRKAIVIILHNLHENDHSSIGMTKRRGRSGQCVAQSYSFAQG